jgi:hypothetical protein
MVALGRPWAHSKRDWSGLIAGKTDDGRRSCSGSVFCAEEGGRKGSLMYSVCCIHGEPLGFGRIPKEVPSTKTVEYRTVSGRVIYYGRMLYRNDFEKSQKRETLRRFMEELTEDSSSTLSSCANEQA